MASETPSAQPQGGAAASNQPPRPPVSFGRKLLALLITLAAIPVIFAIGLEIVFRLFVPVSDVPFYFWDPVTGPRRAPDQRGRYIYGDVINAAYNFNAQGWNATGNYTLDKAAGSRRVCVVGDSMVEALQVDPPETFFHKAELAMSKPDRPVQWYGFGCSGWGPVQEAEAIHHYILDYRPDVVVLVFVQNDPGDNSPYITRLEPNIPIYSLDAHDEIVRQVPRYWQPSTFRRLMSKSALVRYFGIQKQIIDRLRNRRIRNQNLNPVRNMTESITAKDAAVSGDSLDARRARTWLLVEKTLERIRDDCKSRGAVFAVIYRGNYKVLDAAVRKENYVPIEKAKDPYCLRERVDDMGTDFVEPICQRLGIPYMDMTGPLLELIKATGKSHHFPDDVHYNTAAHSKVAETLAPWVESLLPEKSP